MPRRHLSVVFALALMLGSLLIPTHARADEHETLGWGDRGADVVEAQYILVSFGYVLKADGIYGVKTFKAVVKWQKANGLDPDGVVGPKTWDSLISAFQATYGSPPSNSPSAPASSVPSSPEQTPVPVGEPSGYGLSGLPFAPDGLGGCEEMNFYRVQWNLPDQFGDQPRTGPRSQRGFGWRESNCRNDVVSGNGCCVGYWQNYVSSHLSRQSAYRERLIDECQISGRGDVLGNSPLQKQKQACMTAVVYSISGLSPWRL